LYREVVLLVGLLVVLLVVLREVVKDVVIGISKREVVQRMM